MSKNVFLAQVNNSFGRNAFLPYSVGLLWAYAKTKPNIKNAYNLAGFQFLRLPIGEAVEAMGNPDVLGVSCYIWNWAYNIALCEEVRRRYPDCLIILGGPHVPTASEGFFEQHPEIDILVHFEGEHIFADILEEHLNKTSDFKKIPGLSIRLPDNSTFKTLDRQRIAEIDEIPSPYLDGIFDDLMRYDYDFHGSQETHRGCPYSCTFCDWGSAVFTKVRSFSDQRLREEIDWFADNGIELVYNCDANYGIMKRDLELTQYLVDTKAKKGKPEKFRAAYAKKSNDRVFEISRLLNNAGMSKGVTLSLQSVNENTLSVIKRSNIAMDDFAAYMNRYRSAGIPTYTEIIIGLPGETYESFAEGIDRIIEAGQHDGLFLFPCMRLPNSELGDEKYIAEYQIETRCVPVLPVHATMADDGITETQDLVVQTNTMSVEDWRRMMLLAWMLQSLHSMPLLQDIAIYLRREEGIRYREFYERLIDYAGRDSDTLLGCEFASFESTLDAILNETGRPIFVKEFGDITWPPEEAAFLRLIANREKFYSEIKSFMYETWPHLQDDRTGIELADVVSYQQNTVLSPGMPETFNFGAACDFPSYFNSGSEDALRSGPVSISADAPPACSAGTKDYAREIVWYGRKGGQLRARISSVKPATVPNHF